MKISCRKKIAFDSKKDAILVPVYKNIRSLKPITGRKIDDEIENIIQSDYFNFQEKEVKSFYIEINKKLKKIYLINAPKELEDKKKYLELGAKFAKILKTDKIESISMISFEDIYNEKKDFSATYGFIEGMMFGLYSFDMYKTKKESYSPVELEVITSQQRLKNYIDECSDDVNTIFKNVNMTRDLVNIPANDLTPIAFAKYIKDQLAENINIEIFDEKAIVDNGYSLIDAVGRGSANKPRFVKLFYNGDEATEFNIALVGKGVTFDTGGTNLKPSGSIESMKCDMAGAATVFSVINLIAELKLKVNIYAYLPLVENCISSTAIKPSDVIKSASGKTVEIMNTDAEGRLILADACYLATKTDPEVIVDVATLTGACVVALGPYCAGFFSNRKFLSKQLADISSEIAEDVWELPIYEGYESGIDSTVADMQNMSSFKREGGAIHAAIFLKQFVDNYPWIHLDIAGPAFLDREHPIFGKEATGFGVRLIYNFIKTHYCKRGE